jgi:pilus assembly protein CpaB
MLRDGLKAFTVRVNDVDGVAGFVLPGDRVDVALTRQVDKTLATTDIVLQNARVLAIDQVADERTDKPSVAKAVTLEVDVVGAQKLSLSATIGSLSLMLRKAGDSNAEYTRRVSLRDLESATTPVAKERKSAETATVTVTRASVRQEYNVPVETVSDLQAAAVRR